MEIKCLIALHNRVTLAHLHDTNLILNRLPLRHTLWLSEFQGEQLAVANSHAAEHPGKATRSLLADNLVKLGWILLLNVGSVLDLSRDFTAVFQSLLGLVKLTQNNLQEGARVV